MPRELPGLYWDETRNRYFSVSSKPTDQGKLKAEHSRPQRLLPISSLRGGPCNPSKILVRKRQDPVLESLQLFQGTSYSYHRQQHRHNLLSSQIALTSYFEKTCVPMWGTISAFRTTLMNGEIKSFLGDTRGWIYSYTGREDKPPSDDQVNGWIPELNLQSSSEISSICLSLDRCVATTFGPSCKILIQNLHPPAQTFILSVKDSIHDIWTSSMHGSTLVVGANKQAVYISNVDATPPLRILDTQSDVFAIHQEQAGLVYTGARNGSITRFDTRAGKPQGQKLFEERFGQQRSSVLYLNVIRDWQLLVSHMNGDLVSFDIRYPRNTAPLMAFPEHANSLTQSLGITVDPSENFLFAAGEDCRIRGWSLQTGEPLATLPMKREDATSSLIPKSDRPNPFRAVYPKPATSLQITVNERSEMYLWAASDQNLYQYRLAQWTS